MSEIGRSARVSITVADYIAPGQASKLTIVGAGITILGCDQTTGRTAPISVIATVTFDPKFVGESPHIELSLETADGAVVEISTTADASSDHPKTEPLRVGGPHALLPTVLKGVDIPADAVRPKAHLLMQFQSGLTLEPGQRYLWRITIDDETRDEWTDAMYVPKMSAPPTEQ
jgi:hypothetical protein